MDQKWLEKIKKRLLPYVDHKGPIFDIREENSGLISYIKELGLPHQVDQLHIGDVAISDKTVIEIKRITHKGNDLRASLFDNRLYPQAKDRKENYSITIMLVEMHKGVKPFDDYFTKEHWNSLITTLAIDYHTTTLTTDSTDETIQIIYDAWFKEISNDHYISPCNKKPKPKTMREKQLYFLSGLDDIGDKGGNELLDLYKTPINILAMIIDTQITYTKGGNPRRPVNLPDGFGPLFIIKNQELLLNDTSIKEKETLKNNGDKKDL